ncbi:MAG TPA: hypothetical protein VN976_22095 [Verrucomicrobiae bacterium]|nr:hypothetical protein [Verrucomicrobiae bacterium]
MISNANFQVLEYEWTSAQLVLVYRSSDTKPLCLRDASRMAAALSYAKRTFVQVLSVTPGELYTEWWYGGHLDCEPTIEILEFPFAEVKYALAT